MNSQNRTSNIEESDSDFVQLLREIQAGEASPEALLEHPVFETRLRLIAMTLAQTTEDAEELASDVRIKVWQKLRQFKPDYEKRYGNFFAWLRTVARNSFFDKLRRSKVEFESLEAADIPDPQRDIEASVLYKEVLAEFEKSINALPERERLAMSYYLQGFSFRDISDRMNQAGFSSSHVKVAHSIRDVLKAFWERADHANVRSKNVRVRATRAKREFRTIIEQAINSPTSAIRHEDFYRKPFLARGGKRKASKRAQPSSRPGWASANDLLLRMQSPESKNGIQAAFDSSPDELGEAAVEYANRERRIPIDSLSTFLMAASTVNVVGRVMNLTKDVA